MPLQIIRQDITKMHVDAIVNTTNEEMLGYSGIDLALHTLAGAAFDEECRSLAPLALGDAKLTGGYALPAKKVIHTAAPVWRGGNFQEAEILRSCYLACLHLAAKSGCETVAFPLIGTGNYGFPRELVLTLATNAVKEFLIENEMTVFLCVFDRNSYDIGQARFRDIQAFIDDAYEKTHGDEFYASLSMDCPEPSSAPRRAARPSRSSFTNREKSLNDILRQKDKSFAEKLFCFIDARGLTDVQCYKRANVDKRTFSKIKSNKGYRPSKQTAVAFAIALCLSLEETQELLASAGMTLSESYDFDLIIRYFILHENYDIFEINQALFKFDQVLLGSF